MPNSSKTKIIQDTFLLSGRRISNLIIAIIQSYFTVKFLGPQNYGLLAVIGMVSMIGGYVSLGWLTVVTREVPHYRGTGDYNAEAKVRNNAFTIETLMAGLTSIATLIIALVYIHLEKWNIAFLLVLAAISLIPQKFLRFYHVRNYYEKDFKLQTKVDVYRQLAISSLIIATVWKYGVYSVVIIPIAIDILCVFYYRYNVSLHFSFKLEFKEIKRITKIGVPLQISGLLSGDGGILKWTESTLLVSQVGLVGLGCYAFAYKICWYLMLFFREATTAFQPHLYESLGRDTSQNSKEKDIRKPSLMLFYSCGIVIGCLYIVLPEMISFIFPRYIDSIPLLRILLVASYFFIVTQIDRIILYSVVMNCQIYYVVIWIASIAVFTCCSFFLLKLGYGTSAIAFSLLICYLVLILLSYIKTLPFYLQGKKERIVYLLELVGPIIYYLVLDAIVARIFASVVINRSQFFLLFTRILMVAVFSIPLLIRLQKISGLLTMVMNMICQIFHLGKGGIFASQQN